MPSLTELLASGRARILRRWTERIQGEHAQSEISRVMLWDDLPQILHELETPCLRLKGDRRITIAPGESCFSQSRDTGVHHRGGGPQVRHPG
jgi:hypothetical protein